MRPEDIKVGTVFVDVADKLSVIVDVSSNANQVTSMYLDSNEEIHTFFVDDYYARNCKKIFVPSQSEKPIKSEDNLILPPYYATDTHYEPFKIADFYNMNIREFSALKYLLRSKDESKRVEDLKKAITCIHKEIIRLESLKESGN